MADVHTAPADLPELTVRAVLQSGWALDLATVRYRPVGFGSHHWEVVDRLGHRFFVTVDDLRTRRLSHREPHSAAYGRLRSALAAAQALQEAGRGFVVAPLPAVDGGPLGRITDSYAVAVYPFIEGASFDWDSFTPAHRQAVVGMLAAVHSAPPEVRDRARVDDHAIPFRDNVVAALAAEPAADPVADELGPYARPAAELLLAHAAGVRRAFGRYDEMVAVLRGRPSGLVLTHGEPHAANTMRSNGGWRLIDWDTALVAPPERDLWDLDEGDGQVHAAYRNATGRLLRPDLLELYRLRWDLAEITACLARFHEPHADTADDQETWTILEETVTGLGD